MALHRAYSLLEVKAVDEEKRIITGIASTPRPDRSLDIVDPMGAKFVTPMPLLLYHKSTLPVGTVNFAKPNKDGIPFSASIPDVVEPGIVQDRVNEAWHSVKYKLIAAVSIGFMALENGVELLKTGGLLFKAWEWLELSLVTIPDQRDAVITGFKSMSTADLEKLLGTHHADNDVERTALIKSLQLSQRAASGNSLGSVVRLEMPGASGSKTKGISAQPKPKPLEGNSMTTAEQIKAFSDQRTAKAAAMDEIMKKSGESGETLDAEQSEKYDTLAGEIDTIDKHLARLRNHEKSLAAGATAVRTVGTPEELAKGGTVSRGGDGVIAVARKLAPGVAFARYAGIMAAAKGSISDAVLLAKSTFPDEAPLLSVISNHSRILKSPTDIGTTLDSDYAAPLVQYQQMAQEFIEFLRPQTIVGRITGLRKVPFNIRVPRQLTGGSASWVGEAAPKPVTSTTLDSVTLKYKKLATIAVISDELARFSSPSAELIIRDTLAGAIIQQMDSDFVNPANAGTSDVKPASITNTATPVASAGNTQADVLTDVSGVFAPFILANLTPVNGVWLMSATNALALSLMITSLGQPAFPGVNMTGGTFQGLPVIVSEAVGNIVVLLNASDILLADDGQVTIDTSREASLQMDSEPTNPPVAATVFISLWQQNLLGIRAERYIDWVKARAQSVQYLSGVAWGQPGS